MRYKISYKNRIAFNYIISTALLIFIVFLAIFYIVKYNVYTHINNDIANEVDKHLNEIVITDTGFDLTHSTQWLEREHNVIDVNPVFMQFINNKGIIIEKSPNLKSNQLTFFKNKKDFQLFDTQLYYKNIRQIQVPIFKNKTPVGYIVIAMSLEDSKLVLNNLLKTLIISYPLILLLLFFIARFIAGRSIKPIVGIINTSNIITKDNLSSRINLPDNKDELFILSKTINDLLDRLATTIAREKQFTSDASHELRTPLAVIKGTLEVLIRKPREPIEYQQKIEYCINQVDQLNQLVDQLLLLARFDNQNPNIQLQTLDLQNLCTQSIHYFSTLINNKKGTITTHFAPNIKVCTDSYLFSIICNNILSNAIKYSPNLLHITITTKMQNNQVLCCIQDKGTGIDPQDLTKIFLPFYRTDAASFSKISGNGLGLPLVKRLCNLLNIGISIHSEPNKGTKVQLVFTTIS